MRTKYLLFFHHTTRFLEKLRASCFEHSGHTCCSPLVNPGTRMKPRNYETCACWYIRSKFIHWALWRTLMGTEYFLFVHHTTSILGKLRTWQFRKSGDINCPLLVNPSHTDESWKGRNTWMWIYMVSIYWLSTLENTDKNRIFFARSPHHKHFGKAHDLVLGGPWWH